MLKLNPTASEAYTTVHQPVVVAGYGLQLRTLCYRKHEATARQTGMESKVWSTVGPFAAQTIRISTVIPDSLI